MASPTGASCTAASDCQSSVCFVDTDAGTFTGWSGGMCAEPCVGGQCPEGLGCAVLGGEQWCLPACADGSSCREGYVCNPDVGACLPDCRLGWDCGEDFSCSQDGTCSFDWPALVPAGGPCQASFDCESGWCIPPIEDGQFTGWTDGTCSQPCENGACPGNAKCVLLDGKPMCIPGCDTDADCRQGYLCDPPLKACLPDCRLGWDCGEGYSCSTDGICDFDWPALVPAGGPCQASFDCESGWCIPPYEDEKFTGWTDGTCSVPCSGGACPDGLRCVVLQAESYCLPECLTDADCRQGYVCYPSLLACLPDCNLGWPCEPPYVCDQSGLCQAEPAQDPCSDQLNPTCLPSQCQTETAASGTCGSPAGSCKCVATAPPDNPCSFQMNPTCTPGPCQLPDGMNGTCAWQFGQCACMPTEPPDSPCSPQSNPQCSPSPCPLPDGTTGTCGNQFMQCTCRPKGGMGG